VSAVLVARELMMLSSVVTAVLVVTPEKLLRQTAKTAQVLVVVVAVTISLAATVALVL